MILCGGDALIDFVPTIGPDGTQSFTPRAGGAVLNAATALARLEEDVAFMGGLSTDLFGDFLFDHMMTEGIATELVTRTGDDSTLAFVTLTGGEARYAFYDSTSAGRRWTGPPELPAPTALHIGSVTLIGEPSASAYANLAQRLCEKTLISLDPNCRPSLIGDAKTYRSRIAGIIANSHVLRLSDEDFTYLYPSADEQDVIADLLSGTTRLVIVSRGPDGASAYWSGGRMDVSARPVVLKDSIGAGDTFHAGILAALSQTGHLSIDGLATLDHDAILHMLAFATAAAALNCATSGCNPPTRADVLAALKKA